MRPEIALAERRQCVRDAAAGWRRAGAVDDTARAAIDRAYADDRSRLGPVFRVLVFGFTFVAVTAFLGLVGLVAQAGGGGLLLFLAIPLVIATELQLGPLRRRQAGAESATAFLSACFALGGSIWLLLETLRLPEQASINLALVLTTLVFGAAALRWGYTVFALVAAVAAYLLLARCPLARWLWIAIPVLTVVPLLRLADSVRLAPSHRRSSEAVALASLVFLYLAVHVGSWDRRVVEMVATEGRELPPVASPLRPLFVIATGALPLLVVCWGIAARRRSLLDLGLAGVLASLMTLRFYVHLAPLWVVLVLGGSAAIGLALLLRRYLDSDPGHERHGFTAEPLFVDPRRRSALEVAASVVALGPAARPAEKPGGFEAGGGGFGGGGASGEY